MIYGKVTLSFGYYYNICIHSYVGDTVWPELLLYNANGFIKTENKILLCGPMYEVHLADKTGFTCQACKR
jgi:hypothetical protein